MTRNQIEYWNLQELKRSNLAREAETARSNLAKEQETHRSNVTKEEETHRSNFMNEFIDQTRNQEIKRSNLENERQGRYKIATDVSKLLKDILLGRGTLLGTLGFTGK